MRIASAGFAPVKGTAHVPFDEVLLDERGPVGDRAFCLVDAAARRVLRTVQNPSLVAVRARLEGSRLDVVLPSGESADAEPTPSGERVTCEYWGRAVDLDLLAGPHSALFSSYLGLDVRLAAAPRGGVVYDAPVTLVSTASLRDLGNRLGRTDLEPQRFRATVVVDVEGPAYVEESWEGRQVDLGEARVLVGGRIPRCAVVDLDPATGVKDAPVLRTLAGYRPHAATGEPCFGMYAEVVGPGRLRRGARVTPYS